jgi:hypothetical protein
LAGLDFRVPRGYGVEEGYRGLRVSASGAMVRDDCKRLRMVADRSRDGSDEGFSFRFGDVRQAAVIEEDN